MATTNRQYDDGRLLAGLAQAKGLELGDYLMAQDVQVLYDSPTANGVMSVIVEATLSWRLTPEQTAEILASAEE